VNTPELLLTINTCADTSNSADVGSPKPHTPHETFLTNLPTSQLRQDPHGQDHYPRGRVQRYNRQCQEQDPGQGRHSTGPAAFDLRRQATRGWPYPLRLQHSEGEHASLGVETEGWYHRAIAQGVGEQVQLRQDDLPKVLRKCISRTMTQSKREC
jgi:hypothetical protein